jgi:hypothetical protein
MTNVSCLGHLLLGFEILKWASWPGPIGKMYAGTLIEHQAPTLFVLNCLCRPRSTSPNSSSLANSSGGRPPPSTQHLTNSSRGMRYTFAPSSYPMVDRRLPPSASSELQQGVTSRSGRRPNHGRLEIRGRMGIRTQYAYL